MQDEAILWWLKALAFASFSALGGVLGHVMRSLDKRETINITRCILEGISAGFVGLLVLLMCETMHVGEQWTGVIVGVSGWLGASATIRMIETMVWKKFGLNKVPDVKDPSQPG